MISSVFLVSPLPTRLGLSLCPNPSIGTPPLPRIYLTSKRIPESQDTFQISLDLPHAMCYKNPGTGDTLEKENNMEFQDLMYSIALIPTLLVSWKQGDRIPFNPRGCHRSVLTEIENRLGILRMLASTQIAMGVWSKKGFPGAIAKNRGRQIHCKRGKKGIAWPMYEQPPKNR